MGAGPWTENPCFSTRWLAPRIDMLNSTTPATPNTAAIHFGEGCGNLTWKIMGYGAAAHAILPPLPCALHHDSIARATPGL